MRRALVALVLAGCVPGEITAGDGGGSDTHPPVGIVPSCENDGSFPALPPICIGAWCMESGVLGPITAVHQSAGALWLAVPGHAVRIVGSTTTAYALPTGQPIDRFIGTEQTGLWALSYNNALWFDGIGWHETPIHGTNDIAPIAPGDAWGLSWSSLMRWDGVSWEPYFLGPDFDWAPERVVNMHAIVAPSPTELWVSVERVDHGVRAFFLLHRASGAWQAIETPIRGQALWASGPGDVWLSDDETTVHYDGRAFTSHPVRATMLGGTGPHDVWAYSRTTFTAAHWNGADWTSCVQLSARALSVGRGGDVWGVRDDGSLVHHDGAVWSETRRISPKDIHAIGGGDDMMMLAYELGVTTLWRRAPTGSWGRDNTFPPSDAYRLTSHAANDIWAWGGHTLHFDGTSWRDRSPPGSISSLCLDGGDAYALTSEGAMHFDGTSWSGGRAPTGNDLYCVRGGEVWSASSNDPLVARRAGDRWTATIGEHVLGRAYAPPTGPIWSTLPYLATFDGDEWLLADRRGLEPITETGYVEYNDVGGTSSSDVWLLVEVWPNSQETHYLAHHDGSTFDRTIHVGNAQRISVLAADDVMVVGKSFETQRVRAGVAAAVTSGVVGSSLGNGVGSVWFASPSRGFAISDEGHLLAFDGTAWSRVTGVTGAASGLLGLAADDVWTIHDRTALAHFDGTGWTVLALPLATGEYATALWGASPAELWVTTSEARVLRVSSGVASGIDLGLTVAERPITLTRVHGRSASDIWFSGTRGTGEHALYHWDGATFSLYRTLRNVLAMQYVNDVLLAAGSEPEGTVVWQRIGTRWQRRPDLDPLVVFPTLRPLPALPFGGTSDVERAASGSTWAIGTVDAPTAGTVLWRTR